MIGKNELTGLGFSTVEEYYGYIVESEENGQFEQVKELIQKLSQKQYNGFLVYLKDLEIKLTDHFLR